MKKILSIFLVLFLFQINAQQQFEVKSITVNQWIDGDLYWAKDAGQSGNLVILIAGSGPTDRNGNQQGMMVNNSYKLLAEGLADKGISVFTFDKAFLKKMKEPGFKEEDLTFDGMADDLVEIIKYFKKEHSGYKIWLAGHSEGSLVGILAGQKEKIAGFISIAGTGEPIDETMQRQISKQAPFLADETAKILAKLKAGEMVEDVNPMLQAAFSKSVQPYMISWMKYDPVIEIKKLNCPVLVVQGTKDLQITEEDARKLHAALPSSQLNIIENMNHVLKIIEGDDAENMAAYSDPEKPVSAELIEIIGKFVK